MMVRVHHEQGSGYSTDRLLEMNTGTHPCGEYACTTNKLKLERFPNGNVLRFEAYDGSFSGTNMVQKVHSYDDKFSSADDWALIAVSVNASHGVTMYKNGQVVHTKDPESV